MPIPGDSAPPGPVVEVSAPWSLPCIVGGAVKAAVPDKEAIGPKVAAAGAGAEVGSPIAGAARPSPLDPPSGR